MTIQADGGVRWPAAHLDAVMTTCLPSLFFRTSLLHLNHRTWKFSTEGTLEVLNAVRTVPKQGQLHKSPLSTKPIATVSIYTCCERKAIVSTFQINSERTPNLINVIFCQLEGSSDITFYRRYVTTFNGQRTII